MGKSKKFMNTMTKEVYFLIPSLNKTSPINGAFTLANMCTKYHKTKIIYFGRKKNKLPFHLNDRVNLLNISFFNFLIFFFKYLFKIFDKKFRKKTIFISFTLKSDLLNSFLFFSKSISSIRGNYYLNYKLRFPLLSILLFNLHYYCLKRINNLIVMNEKNIDKFSSDNFNIFKINNCIDEENIFVPKLKIKNNDFFDFCYFGNFNEIKNIPFLIDKFILAINKNKKIRLIMAGQGKLLYPMKKKIQDAKMSENIILLGHVADIFNLLPTMNANINISFSEGTSRATLEALYSGIPCLLNDSEINNKLIISHKHGRIVKDLSKLEKDIELFYLEFSKFNREITNLIPLPFRQKTVQEEFINMINNF